MSPLNAAVPGDGETSQAAPSASADQPLIEAPAPLPDSQLPSDDTETLFKVVRDCPFGGQVLALADQSDEGCASSDSNRSVYCNWRDADGTLHTVGDPVKLHAQLRGYSDYEFVAFVGLDLYDPASSTKGDRKPRVRITAPIAADATTQRAKFGSRMVEYDQVEFVKVTPDSKFSPEVVYRAIECAKNARRSDGRNPPTPECETAEGLASKDVLGHRAQRKRHVGVPSSPAGVRKRSGTRSLARHQEKQPPAGPARVAMAPPAVPTHSKLSYALASDLLGAYRHTCENVQDVHDMSEAVRLFWQINSVVHSLQPPQ